MSKIVLGQMTGTSLDGMDLALTRIKNEKNDVSIELLNFDTIEYPTQLRSRIQKAFTATTHEVCALNYDLGKWVATKIQIFCKKINFDISNIDLIGLHGQTIYHIDQHSTLQIGEADTVSFLTNTPVIYDFRSADIAAGGTGAPLIPYLDKVLLSDRDQSYALQNIGGIGNVTYLPKNIKEDIIAFDTGPANAILNEAVEIITNGAQQYDKDGLLSSQGKIIEVLLEELLNHEYFNKALPKSTGRELFGKNFVLNIFSKYEKYSKTDILRTFVLFIAKSIEVSYKVFLPDINQILLSGGGIHNLTLKKDLISLFPNKIKMFSDILPFPADAKEAIGFALFAYERVKGNPTNLPEVTGAKNKVLLGKISNPKGLCL